MASREQNHAASRAQEAWAEAPEVSQQPHQLEKLEVRLARGGGRPQTGEPGPLRVSLRAPDELLTDSVQEAKRTGGWRLQAQEGRNRTWPPDRSSPPIRWGSGVPSRGAGQDGQGPVKQDELPVSSEPDPPRQSEAPTAKDLNPEGPHGSHIVLGI